MKITIRNNPEIVIDVDSVVEEKTLEPIIVVADVEVAPDVKAGAGRRRN